MQQSGCTESNKNFQRHILCIDSQYTSNEDIECRAGKTRSNRLASQKNYLNRSKLRKEWVTTVLSLVQIKGLPINICSEYYKLKYKKMNFSR